MDLAGTRTLHDLLEHHGARNPDRRALVHEDATGAITEVTYGALLDKVRRTATGLAGLGVAQGDAVVLMLPNGPEFIFAWFGLAVLGAAAAPVHTASTVAELEHVLELSQAVAIITTPELGASMASTLADHVTPDRVLVTGPSASAPMIPFDDILATDASPPSVSVTADDVAMLILTSGTTARPKAVMLTHANALLAGARVARTLALTPQDRLLTAMPLHHVNAQETTVLAAIDVGATFVVLERYSASNFWRQVRHHRATAVSLVAMHVRTLLAQPRTDDDQDHRLRCCIYAINVADDEKVAFESRFGLELTNGYGLSEAGTLVTIAPLFGDKRWPSVGPPALDRLVRIVDEDGRDVPVGQEGEILVGGIPGRTLMKGYLGDPEATRAALDDGWLRTGDVGLLDEKGYLHFVDRRKDVIKVAGENVSASEVEMVLRAHPAIDDAAVISVPDPIRDEAVKAFVVPLAGVSLTEGAVVAHCRERLSAFKVPTIIEIRDDLPRTSIGKIAKKQLR